MTNGFCELNEKEMMEVDGGITQLLRISLMVSDICIIRQFGGKLMLLQISIL